MSHAQVVVLGAGVIGRELLTQLATNPRGAAQPLVVCGAIDRSGYVLDAGGLTPDRVARLCAGKAAGISLAAASGGQPASTREAIDAIREAGLDRPLLVDATAADTVPHLLAALRHGCDVVLANKRPLSGPQAEVDCLLETARVCGRRVLHEATVGAGLPVIDTIRKLLDAGDRIRAIEGCPSGTLGFLFGELGRGRAFSHALRDAVAAGYTEPDPRADLSGLDVARKALILARLIGYRGDPEDIVVESLVPHTLRDPSVAAFLDSARELDEPWRERVSAVRARGCTLRYRAHVTSRSVTVGLAEVPLADRLAALSGTDNQFTFTTERYGEQRLTITGPGAGPAVTAQGIYADLLRLASEQIGDGGYGVLTSTPASRSALINAGS